MCSGPEANGLAKSFYNLVQHKVPFKTLLKAKSQLT